MLSNEIVQITDTIDMGRKVNSNLFRIFVSFT